MAVYYDFTFSEDVAHKQAVLTLTLNTYGNALD